VPITVNYYTLNNIETSTISSKSKITTSSQRLILLSPIVLADFLTTGALVMQLESHKIQLSSRHRWADNLTDAITRNLLAKLEGKMSNYHFEQNDSHWKNSAKVYIKVNINQFTALTDKATLTSGTFWLFNKDNKFLNKQSFNIKKQLTNDGYNHAVSKLELSLTELAEQITSAVRLFSS